MKLWGVGNWYSGRVFNFSWHGHWLVEDVGIIRGKIKAGSIKTIWKATVESDDYGDVKISDSIVEN